MKKLILSLSLALFAISCSSNDDDETTVPVEETPVLPTKSSSSNESPATIKYNGNKILESTWVDGKFVYEYTGNLISKTIEYNAAGNKIGTTDFTYSNDKLIKVVNTGTNFSETITYSYPTANTINATDTRNSTFMGSPIVNKDVVTYTLSNGNVDSEESTYYHNGVLAGKLSVTYSYDGKNSVCRNILGFDKIMIYNFARVDENTSCFNNLLIKNQTNAQVGYNVSKYKNVNTITYSAAGYPTQIITNQYNESNQLNSTSTNFFEYNK